MPWFKVTRPCGSCDPDNEDTALLGPFATKQEAEDATVGDGLICRRESVHEVALAPGSTVER